MGTYGVADPDDASSRFPTPSLPTLNPREGISPESGWNVRGD